MIVALIYLYWMTTMDLHGTMQHTPVSFDSKVECENDLVIVKANKAKGGTAIITLSDSCQPSTEFKHTIIVPKHAVKMP